jgi:hypothetical protein
MATICKTKCVHLVTRTKCTWNLHSFLAAVLTNILSCVLSDRQETGVLGLPMMVGEQKKRSNSLQKVNLVAFVEYYEL